METEEWMLQFPQFADLEPELRQAVSNFTLLWTLFEAAALNTNASSNQICKFIDRVASGGGLNEPTFQPCLAYFQSRYFQDGDFNYRFEALLLRKNDKLSLVRAVLSGADNDPTHRVAVLFIIIYRLRNNLFHGMKWAYKLAGQRENFENANQALMSAVDAFAPWFKDNGFSGATP